MTDWQNLALRLAREVKGSFELFEPLARREMGNTNYTIIVEAADAILAADEKSSDLVPVYVKQWRTIIMVPRGLADKARESLAVSRPQQTSEAK